MSTHIQNSKGTEIYLVLNNFFLSSETIPVQPLFRVNI
jgi:hypothetical protein